jgi:uncharacterized membrane protein
MPKAMTQDKVRQVMKDAGFTNVTIMDAAYLVQATTKDGDQMLVLVNAPMMQAAAQTSGSQGGSSGGTTGSTSSGKGAGSGGPDGGAPAAPKQ